MTSSRARSAMTWGGNGVTTAVGIAIVAMCALTVLPAEQAAPPAPARAALAAQDYIDIQQLVRKYAWALDGGDNYGYGYADLFTPDGVFVGMNQGPDGRSYQGRDVLAALARTPRGGPNHQRHFTMNHVIAPAPRQGSGQVESDGPRLRRDARRRRRRNAERGEPRRPLRGRLREDERRLAVQETDVLGIEGGHMAFKVVIALVASVLVAGAIVRAQQRSSAATPALTPQDYIDIQQLVSSYPYGLDGNTDNGATYANLFAPGAVFGRPRTEGRDNLAALANTQPRGANYVRHFITNHVIEPAPGGAIGREYAVIIDIGENGKPGGIALGGRYDDEYVKTPQGWKFKTRTFTPSRVDVQPQPATGAGRGAGRGGLESGRGQQ